MICPKCGLRMYHYAGPSTTSGLRLGSATMISGYQCPPHGCGKWVDDNIEPICPKPEFMGFPENSKNTRLHGKKATEIIRANFDAITAMKKQKWGWKDICDRFKVKIHHQLACKKYHEIAREA